MIYNFSYLEGLKISSQSIINLTLYYSIRLLTVSLSKNFAHLSEKMCSFALNQTTYYGKHRTGQQ